MNSIRAIRTRLKVTQAELAKGVECTQANVHFYEQGQTFPPARARKLIEFARSLGHIITLDDIYAFDSSRSESSKGAA